MTPEVDSTATRLCNRCGRDLPLDAFRLRYKGGSQRHSQCNACRNSYERRQRWMKQRGELNKGLTQLMRGGPDHVSNAINALIHKFGGLHRFTESWWHHFEEAQTRRYGAGFVLKTFLAVAHMIEVNEKQTRAYRESLPDLDDEDLARAACEILGKMVRERQLDDVLREMAKEGVFDLQEIVSQSA